MDNQPILMMFTREDGDSTWRIVSSLVVICQKSNMEPEKWCFPKGISFFPPVHFQVNHWFFWGNICLVFVHIVIISLLPKPSLLPSTVRSHPRCLTWDGTTPPLVIGVFFIQEDFFYSLFSKKHFFHKVLSTNLPLTHLSVQKSAVFFSKKFPPACWLTHSRVKICRWLLAPVLQLQVPESHIVLLECSHRNVLNFRATWILRRDVQMENPYHQRCGFGCLVDWLIGWLVVCLLVLFFVPAELLMDFFLVSGHHVVHTGMQRKGVSNGWLSAGWTLQNSNPCLPQLALS